MQDLEQLTVDTLSVSMPVHDIIVGMLLSDSIVFTNTGLQISRLVLTVSESILFPITDLVISLKHCYFH